MSANNRGDRGQRYEVWATQPDGTDKKIGWTNDPSGGGILQFIARTPTLSHPRLVDRFPGIDQLIRWREFKAGCRKDIEQIYRGHDHCYYCQTPFPLLTTVYSSGTA